MSLPQKMRWAFAAIVLIGLVLNSVVFLRMHPVGSLTSKLANEYMEESRLASRLHQLTGAISLDMGQYAMTGQKGDLDAAMALFSDFEKTLKEAQKTAQEHPDLDRLATLTQDLARRFPAWRELATQTGNTYHMREYAGQGAEAQGRGLLANLRLLRQKEIDRLPHGGQPGKSDVPALQVRLQLMETLSAGIQDIQSALMTLQAHREEKPIQAALGKVDPLAQTMTSLLAAPGLAPEDRGTLDELKQTQTDYVESVGNTLDAVHKASGLYADLSRTNAEILKEVEAVSDAGQDRTVSVAHQSAHDLGLAETVTLSGGLISIVLGSLLSVLLARQIASSIGGVTRQLEASSRQTEEAGHAVRASSQTLAQGTCQQAASLEEVSAALEEVNSMTQRNAAGAGEAKALALDTAKTAANGEGEIQKIDAAVSHAQEAVTEMRGAMTEIQESSAAIGKIIKTIDEIAFQTNILALNAAVEAARAGEAGAGFAVVADEVRNLAQRCTQAARETTVMIEDSALRSDRGMATSKKVDSSLKEIAVQTEQAALRLREIVAKVNETSRVVQDIASSSLEQERGLGSVTASLLQMDQTTQQASSQAEEMAGAAEQLQAQTRELRESVGAIHTLMTGHSSPREESPSAHRALADANP